jgi:transcriptional regulator with XRE-family HTH domain
MDELATIGNAIDQRLAERLRDLRAERGWSLDELARQSGVSRASLSRLENAETSPTASVLGRLCAAFGLTLSRLMQLVEGGFTPHLKSGEQPVWTDPETGFRRRQVSPPAETLAGEVLECELGPGTRIAYERPPRPGLEHHLVMVEGRLEVTVEGAVHDMDPGDCLRYRLFGESLFRTPENSGAKYLLFIV